MHENVKYTHFKPKLLNEMLMKKLIIIMLKKQSNIIKFFSIFKLLKF